MTKELFYKVVLILFFLYTLFMVSFLLTQEVINEAKKLVTTIKKNNSVSFPPDEKYPLSLIKEGNMLGVMIAETKEKERKVLYSFSGALSSVYNIPGYVHTCFSEKDFDNYMLLFDKEIHELSRRIENGEVEKKEERKQLSRKAQKEYEKIFSFYTWNGEKIKGLPPHSPTGTGECAGLKLINTALKRGWEIKGLAEFRYNKEEPTVFFPPCTERCALLLRKMLGLDYIYLDEDIAIVNKEPHFLSVPGRGEEKLDSVSYRFHTLFPSSPLVPHAHRLDMDTSGIMILAFNKEALKNLSLQFEERKVKKSYIALLDGVIKEERGIIELPMRLDVDNRPYQIIDREKGKEAITEWERIDIEKREGRLYTRVHFYPHTGRTHQLRLHAKEGLKHPIKGDNLYGVNENGERLFLHASSIEFHHPRDNRPMKFEVEPNF